MVDISSPEGIDTHAKKSRDVTSTLDHHVVSQIYKTLDFHNSQKVVVQEKPTNDHDSAHEAFRKYVRERQL